MDVSAFTKTMIISKGTNVTCSNIVGIHKYSHTCGFSSRGSETGETGQEEGVLRPPSLRSNGSVKTILNVNTSHW